MHRSRLGGFIIDCQTDDLEQAATFWSAALGLPIASAPEADPGYLHLARAAGGLYVEVQRVSHESRVHLDIETDDVEAEAQRLEALGARRLQARKDWVVMQAPTGQKFCIVPAESPQFAATAKHWDKA